MAELPPDSKKPANPERARAIALKRDLETHGGVPRIVASGQGDIAERIIALAKEHGITIQKDADLAEILSAMEVDSLIPLEAYQAVANIFSYIYKTNAKIREQHKDMLK